VLCLLHLPAVALACGLWFRPSVCPSFRAS